MPRPKRLNKEDINPEKLRTFEGFENITQEEAEMICHFTIELCSIAYEAHINNKRRQDDE